MAETASRKAAPRKDPRTELSWFDQALLEAKNLGAVVQFWLTIPLPRSLEVGETAGVIMCHIYKVDKYAVCVELTDGTHIWISKSVIAVTEINK